MTSPPTGAGWRSWRSDVAVAAPAWVVARLVVLLALAVAHYVANRLTARPSMELHLGLMGWDSQWYREIARHGYGHLAPSVRRFFPLYPLAARTLAAPFGTSVDWALLVLSNGAALLYGALVVRLVRLETSDTSLAHRAAWLVALVPPAFVLAFGYSEAVAGLLAASVFLGLRTRRWWWAACAGFLSGLLRPTGTLLALPALIEAARAWPRIGRRERAASAAAVVAPIAGAGTYLAWVGWRFGNALLPIRVQQRPYLRGGYANPVVALYDSGRDFWAGRMQGNGMHFPLIIVLLALVVVCARRWPASYSAFAAVTMVLALGGQHLSSIERYGFAAFPLVLALASITRREQVWRMVLTVSTTVMAGFAMLAFLGTYIP